MERAIKRVGLHLGKQILNSFQVLIRILGIPDPLGNDQFQQSLKNGFAKSAAKQLKQDVRDATMVNGIVSLSSLQGCILKVLGNVLHQQLNHKAASLLTAVAKHDRRMNYLTGVEPSLRRRLKMQSKAKSNERDWAKKWREVTREWRNANREYRYIKTSNLASRLLPDGVEATETERKSRAPGSKSWDA